MTQPAAYTPLYSYSSELASTTGVHLDAEFARLSSVIGQIEANLSILQRDDTALANQSVGANQFASDGLALVAGTQSTATRWVPRGFWLTATLYSATDIVETGTPGVAYVCTVQHTSGVFATDHAAGKWVVLSAPRTIVSGDVVGALGYTPVNRAGDTMTGPLIMPSGSTVCGSLGMAFTDGLLATQDLVSVNKGFYADFNTSQNANVYGLASNVMRTAGSGPVFGAQVSGYANLLSQPVFGASAVAFSVGSHTGQIVGAMATILSAIPTNSAPKYGFEVLFANRQLTDAGSYAFSVGGTAYSSTGSGLGANNYNRRAYAIFLSSQTHSGSGEYCGWTRGIQFDAFALDSEKDATFSGSRAYPIGINFSDINYNGGSDPVTGYNLEAAIAFRDLQGILWNRDPVNPGTQIAKIRTHFNPFTQRWVLTNGGVERFGIDVAAGTIFLNGSSAGIPSLTAANVWQANNTFNTPLSLGSSLIFSGTGSRILGDFNNATVSSRALFQSLGGTDTFLGVVPNAGAGVSGIDFMTTNAANNCPVGHIAIDSLHFAIQAGKVGTASYVPITLEAGGSEVARVDTSGQFLVGTLVPASAPGTKLRVGGILVVDNSVAFAVHNNAVDETVNDSTFTKVTFSTKEFDQAVAFDTATSRFTPVAGKYQLNACVQYTSTVDGARYATIIYKNGVAYKNNNLVSGGTADMGTSVSCVVDANGTDYFEIFTWHNSGGAKTVSGASTDTWFAGHRIG